MDSDSEQARVLWHLEKHLSTGPLLARSKGVLLIVCEELEKGPDKHFSLWISSTPLRYLGG